VVKGSGSETVDSVQAGSEECLTVSNRDTVQVTGIIDYIKQKSLRAIGILRKATISSVTSVFLSFSLSVCLSVHPSFRMCVSSSHFTDFDEIYISVLLENLSRKFKFI